MSPNPPPPNEGPPSLRAWGASPLFARCLRVARGFGAWAILAARVAGTEPTTVAPALLDAMDGSRPAFRLIDPAPRVALLNQTTLHGATPLGTGGELLVLRIPAGESAQLAYRIPVAPVIPELRLAAWFICDQPGARLGARVELPRTRDERTGQPVRLLVRGEAIAAAHEWQHLELQDLPSAVQRQVRTLRPNGTQALDVRGAVVTDLVLLAPGSREPVTVTVDQVGVHGVLGPAAEEADAIGVQPTAYTEPGLPGEGDRTDVRQPETPRSVIQRVLEWRGEALPDVQRLGFTAILLDRMPSAEELESAARANLRVVCPPPGGARLPAEIEAQRDLIAAWDLGRLAEPVDVGVAFREQNRLRRLDPDPRRPVLLRPGPYVREASRVADGVLAEPQPFAAGLTPGGLARQLGQMVQGGRAGTAFWVALDTQLGRSESSQLALFSGGAAEPREPASYRGLLRAVAAAAACRPQGLVFRSEDALDRRDAGTRQRLLTLQLLNRRLGLLEPWLASGSPAGAARSSRADLTGLVLHAERSFLIVPIAWESPLLGSSPGSSQPVAFVLPGASESADAYLLRQTGAVRLRTQRVAGGMRISAESLPHDGLILVTEDSGAFAQVEQYLQRGAAEVADAWCELSELRLADAQRSWAYLPAEMAQDPLAMEPLARAEALLREARGLRSQGRIDRACDAIAAAEDLLDRLCERLAEQLAGAASLPGEYPAVADWSTLGDLALTAAASQREDVPWQSLSGGEFESLERLLEAGWRRGQRNPPAATSQVRLSSEGSAEGEFCLELSSVLEPDRPPSVAAGPSVWVQSPPVAVPAGHLLEIRGLARNAAPELGGEAPLKIFDSLGGETLAVAAGGSPQWEPFRLRRAALRGTAVELTIAMRGLGAAQVDAVQYRICPLAPPPRRLAGPMEPPAGNPETPAGPPQRLEGPQSIGP